MRILYGIQGTGNGHLSRAQEILPYLLRYGEVDLLISGNHSDIGINHPVLYTCYGLSYAFGKNGGVDLFRSVKQAKPFQLLSDIRKLPVDQYDVVISDFEPITAWAGRLRRRPVWAMSHQAAFLSPKSPRPNQRNVLMERLFTHYAPSTKAVGFHFDNYDSFIHCPIIQRDIRQLHPRANDHITVYLPAYSTDYLCDMLQDIPLIRWEVFAKNFKETRTNGNITLRPVSREGYLRSLESAQGVLTGAGFEAPSEALFLGKKLMVLPMAMQYEQLCNAAALDGMGVAVMGHLQAKTLPKLVDWVNDGEVIQRAYPDVTEAVVRSLISDPGSVIGDQ